MKEGPSFVAPAYGIYDLGDSLRLIQSRHRAEYLALTSSPQPDTMAHPCPLLRNTVHGRSGWNGSANVGTSLERLVFWRRLPQASPMRWSSPKRCRIPIPCASGSRSPVPPVDQICPMSALRGTPSRQDSASMSSPTSCAASAKVLYPDTSPRSPSLPQKLFQSVA